MTHKVTKVPQDKLEKVAKGKVTLAALLLYRADKDELPPRYSFFCGNEEKTNPQKHRVWQNKRVTRGLSSVRMNAS